MSWKEQSQVSALELEAKIKVAIARELQTVADTAIREAVLACERANQLPLLAGLTVKH